ncbi:CmcJ/NvfI family oxidoreductase [Kiloniella majae]|uniref:CmcJ/NvfI family oxidoreductase n=1 Tax=Kiloniella majae TaxID=1938558 RepID=UPI000A2791EE|nr:CmcJ/NvfI family oxidoreductase [Kiloniella majae]
MIQTATVNYHVHKPERQAFHLDADGIKGNLISPELRTVNVPVADARTKRGSVSFPKDSLAFANVPTSTNITTEDNSWREIYDQELTTLLQEKLRVKDVIIFDHTIREDDPDAVRLPARNVHSDYSEDGARQRLIDILGDEHAHEWSKGHYAFINVWRPLENPINSAPLGFVRPSSLDEHDWVLLDLIYPDRRGQIMGLVENQNHEWIYQSKMTPDEIAIFNIYDNRGLPSIAHSALDMIEDVNINTIRKSIESRTLIRY